MFVRSEDSSPPNLVIPDGETFTLRARNSREHPNLMASLYPRTTAALLVAAGRPRLRHRDCPTSRRSKDVQAMTGMTKGRAAARASGNHARRG